MIYEESEKQVDVPLEEVWEWVKNLENIVSVIPRAEIVEMKGEQEATVQVSAFPELFPLSLPDEISISKAKTVEVNEPEKYTRTETKNDVFEIETFLQCKELANNETELHMEGRGELKDTAGTLLEKMLFASPITGVITKSQIDKILEDLGKNLKEYMRTRWKEELEKKTAELESFVYTVSHDLRTPLISLEGFSDMLSEEFEDELGEEGQHYLERIRANVQKMDEFIDDLLQLSRVGRKEVQKEEVDLGELAREVADDLSSRIDEKGIDVAIKDGMPTVFFGRKRMYQVFSNFISNACKYIGDPENPYIKIGAEDRGATWLIWVEDNGIGIDEENQEKIFEIFHREKRAEQEGTGVGLSIVSRIVDNHGGRIWVESEKGEGSTFYIELPQ